MTIGLRGNGWSWWAVLALAACSAETGGPNPPPAPPPAPPVPVASVALARDTATLAAGATLQLAVILTDAQGLTLSGRTVTWTALTPGVASVSNTGLVTAVRLGQARVVAAAEGRSDTATIVVPPSPILVALEPAGARTLTIGPAGGTLHAAAANGVAYTLTVPAGALAAPTAITMTPLASVTGLPLSGGFVAGADLQPDGLVFARPATLTVATSRTARPGQRLVGFRYQGSGDSLAPAPARAAPNSITLLVSHFTGFGAGFGTTQDIEALFLSTPPLPGTSQGAVDLLLAASNEVPRDPANELELMELWFDLIILPEMRAAATDAQLLAAVGAFEMWRRDIPDLLDVYTVVPGGEAAPSLASRRALWEPAFVAKAALAISRNKELCAAPGVVSARIAALDNAIFWHRLATIGYGLDAPGNGVDLTSLQAGLCARSITRSRSVPDPLSHGANALELTFALELTGGPVIPANFVLVTDVVGGQLQLPGATALATPGFTTGVVTPSAGATSMTINVLACYAGGQFLPFALGGDEVCHLEHLEPRVVEAPLITTVALPDGSVGQSYSRTLQATGGLGAYQWTIVSGVLPPGLALGQASGTISGTPTTGGAFPVTVQVSSDGETDQRSLTLTITAGQGLTGRYSGTFSDPSNNLGRGTSFGVSYWLLPSENRHYLISGSSDPTDNTIPRTPVFSQTCRDTLCTQLFDLGDGGVISYTLLSAVPPHPPSLIWTGTIGGGIMHLDIQSVECFQDQDRIIRPCFYTFDGTLTLPFPGPAAAGPRPE